MPLIKAATNNTNLTTDNITTFLNVNTAAGATTLSVKNITNFADQQVLVIGEFGNEGAELNYTNGTPSGSTLTLLNATTFPHSASAPVIVIDFDQVEFSHATTVDASKTVMDTIDITVDVPDFTRYQDNTYSTGFYFIRFKNSLTNVYSDYSDPIPVTGYGIFSARTVIDKALGEINKKTSEVLSDSFAFQQLDNCQTEVLRELKRWSFMQKFDSIIGQVSTGSWKVAIPTDLDDENTNKSIYQLRIGTETRLIHVDKEKFDEFLIGVGYTTLATALAISDTEMVLTDSSDFDDEGTVTIGANSYSYTDNDTSTGTLTLEDAITSDTTAAVGTDVFQGASQGLPRYWTIYGGYIYFIPGTAPSYDGKNIYMDYYIKQTAITGDYDTLVIPDMTLAINYLCWKFLKKLNNGEETEGSAAYKREYETRKEMLKKKEVLGTTFKFRPRIQNFANRSSFNDGTPRNIRDGAFPNTGF